MAGVVNFFVSYLRRGRSDLAPTHLQTVTHEHPLLALRRWRLMDKETEFVITFYRELEASEVNMIGDLDVHESAVRG